MIAYLLDTTTISHLQQFHPRAMARYIAAAAAGVPTGTTTVNVDEATSGWFNQIRQARRPADEARFAGYLADTVRLLADLIIYPVTVPALSRFEALVRLKLNVGRADLKIAAVALELGAVVVTDDRRDFGRVPGLAVEDWLA